MTKEEAKQEISVMEKRFEELKAILLAGQTSNLHDATKPITERIKTFEDVLALVGELEPNVKTLLDYNGINKDMIATQAHLKVILIARALNEGWEPNWDNDDEYKYYPWFYMNTGFGFSYGDCGDDCSFSFVGSRLVFKSEELAKYAAKQFESIYKDFFKP